MKTEEIYKLLVEASDEKTSFLRKNQIQVLLEQETAGYEDGLFAIEGKGAGIQVLLGKLYVDTLRNNQKLLPSLLPVFAIICGYRDHRYIVADADWGFINSL